jgi:hypothetical protein
MQSRTCQIAGPKVVIAGVADLVFAMAIIGIAVACDGSTEPRIPPGAITIEPASASVSLGPIPEASGFVMPITITNGWTQPIYHRDCGFSVERSKRGGDEEPLSWEKVWTPACALQLPPGGAMIALRPGQSVTITVNTLGSGLPPSTQLDGQYRVRFNLFANNIGGFFVLPPEQSTSTPFKLLPVGVMQ